jgi:hypothetical protein
LWVAILRGGEARMIWSRPRHQVADAVIDAQIGMTVMAYNGAVLVRIRQQRLSKRGQKFRRLLGLKQYKINQINDSQN